MPDFVKIMLRFQRNFQNIKLMKIYIDVNVIKSLIIIKV